MKKAIIIGILLGIAWLGMAILFPNKNKSVKIKELNYASVRKWIKKERRQKHGITETK